MNLSKNKPTLLIYFLLLLSFVGFADSTYLTIIHYQNIVPPCSIAHGCEKVLASRFSEIANLPIALIGSVYFTLLIVLNVLLLSSQTRFLPNQAQLLRTKQKRIKLLLILTSLGALIGIFLFVAQGFILKAFCQYCLLVELILFFLFIFSLLLTKKTP